MAKSKKKEPFFDDGRVIANMNVEGMRGYNRAARRRFDEFGEKPKQPDPEPHNKDDIRWVALGTMAAQLFYCLCMFGGLALIILLYFGT